MPGELTDSGDNGPGTDYLNTAFEALSHEVRRHIIYYFRDNTTISQLTELVGFICDRTNRDADAVKANLHHFHLPKLEATNAIEYDSRSETVRYHGGPLIEELADIAAHYE